MEYISVLPGRVRFKSQDIYYNSKLAKHVEKYLHSLSGVITGRVTVNTGSILVIYNENKTNYEMIKENIEYVLTAAKRKRLKNLDEEPVLDSYMTIVENMRRAKRKFILWSLLYILFKLKDYTIGKFPISRNLNVLKAAAAVTIIGGYPAIKKTYQRLTRRIPANTDLLLEWAALSFTVLRESSKGILVLVLKALDDYIKLYAETQSRKAMLYSYEKNFRMAWIKTTEGNDVLISVDTLKIGDSIYVNPGETVPVSGIIEEGSALGNNLYYNGQLLITQFNKGSEIEEGIAIISGNLKIKITKLPDTAEKEDIEFKELDIYKRVKQYQNKITPFAVGTAVVSYLFTQNILNAFAVMLVLSPKASSAALNSGISSSLYLFQKNNIYLKNPNTLENIRKVDTVIFDKTGTLTYGRMRFITAVSYDEAFTQKDLKSIYVACEQGNYRLFSNQSSHRENPNSNGREKSVLIPSKGLAATYKNMDILIGNEDLMLENQVDCQAGMEKYEEFQKNSFIPVYMAVNRNFAGIIVLNDVIKEDAKELIEDLKYQNLKDLALLTGDAKPKAEEIADFLGISRVYSSMNYLDKKQVIIEERNNGTVMMVGDGINDILAMRAANISICFANNSSDKTKHNSDCIIYDENMLKLSHMISLSRKSYTAINRTIFISAAYNIILSTIAFQGGLSIFAAKSLNTLNSMLVLLLNKRILLINPVQREFYPDKEKEIMK